MAKKLTEVGKIMLDIRNTVKETKQELNPKNPAPKKVITRNEAIIDTVKFIDKLQKDWNKWKIESQKREDDFKAQLDKLKKSLK